MKKLVNLSSIIISSIMFISSPVIAHNHDNKSEKYKDYKKEHHHKIKTELVDYKQGNTILQGYLAYPEKINKKVPGIVAVHDWTGVNPDVKKRVEMLAKMGYVAFAADIYGKGINPKPPKEASEMAGKYKSDRNLMRERIKAGLDVLKNNKNVDSKYIAAIGYCFGGTVAIELARSGADLKGVVSFHGGLDSPNPQDGKNIKAKLLILHGADDPYVSEKDIKEFASEMNSNKVDWQMIYYSDAVHSFTLKSAGSDKSVGAAYNELADKRSWEHMKLFFDEIFKK